MWARSLGQKEPLEKGIVIHSGILAWENPMVRGDWQATVHGITESDKIEHTLMSRYFNYIMLS